MADENGVIVYTTEPCGFCRQAKALLEARGVGYAEVNLAKDPVGRADLVALTGQMTFPQIVVGSARDRWLPRAVGGRPGGRARGPARRMTVAEAPVSDGLVGEAPPSPAGPAPDDGVGVRLPPSLRLPRALQTLRFSVRQIEFVFRARRELGEVFLFRGIVDDEIDAVTCHPDHVRSLFTARPEDAPSLTGESPLRPIVGPNSVLTATGRATCASASCCCRPSTAKPCSATRR